MLTMRRETTLPSCREVSVPNFRAEIQARLKALDKTINWLADQVHGKMARNTVYDFLRESSDKHTPSAIRSDKLELLLQVLEKAEREQKGGQQK